MSHVEISIGIRRTIVQDEFGRYQGVVLGIVHMSEHILKWDTDTLLIASQLHNKLNETHMVDPLLHIQTFIGL